MWIELLYFVARRVVNSLERSGVTRLSVRLPGTSWTLSLASKSTSSVPRVKPLASVSSVRPELVGQSDTVTDAGVAPVTASIVSIDDYPVIRCKSSAGCLDIGFCDRQGGCNHDPFFTRQMLN